jgi:WD40 repeat protein
LHSFATCENILGTCVISSDPEKCGNIIVFPGPIKGTINVHNLTTATKVVIKAHESQVTCIAMSRDGKLIVSASERGTLIKIFDTEKGEKIREFRSISVFVKINLQYRRIYVG